MRSPCPLVVLSGALLAACRSHEDPSRRLPSPVPVASAPPAVASPPAPPRPAWTAAFRLRHRPLTTHALPDVIVHAPPGFDARRPFDLVILFHVIASHRTRRGGWWPVTSRPSPASGALGWGLAARHDRAQVNALLIAPQLRPARGGELLRG